MALGGTLWTVNAVRTMKQMGALPGPYTPFSRWAPLVAWDIGELAVWMALGGGVVMMVWSLYVRLFSAGLARPRASAARAHALAYLPLLCSALYLLSDTISPRRALAFALILTVAAHAGVWFRTLWRHDPLARFSGRMRYLIVFATACIIYALLNAGVILHGGVGAGPEGDEPHYLLIAHSLWHDGDLDLSNNFERRDYWAFHPRVFHNHGFTTEAGQMYSRHGVGLPVLILLPYVMGGYYGAELFVAVLTALLALQLYRFLEEATDDRRLAEKTWMLLAFSPPLLIYSSQLYPEVAAGLIALVVLRRTLQFENMEWTGACALGVLTGMLPWLNARYMVLLSVLALCFAYHVWPSKRRALAIFYLLPLIGSISGFLVYNQLLYANPTPLGAYAAVQGGSSTMDFFTNYIKMKGFHGFLGIWFEQRFGLIPASPIYLLALLGLPIALQAYPRHAVWMAAMAGLTWVSLGFYRGWIGGYTPAPRLLVCVVPLLSLPVAAYLSHVRMRVWRVFTAGLAGISYAIALLLCLFPYARYTRSWWDPSTLMGIIRDYTRIDYGLLFPVYRPTDGILEMFMKTGLMLIVLGVLFYLHKDVKRDRGHTLPPAKISIDTNPP